jgi:hypothetical protein
MIEAVLNVMKAALLPVNMPFTILLGGVTLYWLLVIAGALDFELGGHDIDVDTGGHAGDVSGGHEVDGGHAAHDGHDIHHGTGVFQGFLQFLHIGDAPLMIVLSIMSVLGWMFAMLANVSFNAGNSLLIGLGLVVPNLVFTCVATNIIMRPIANFVRSLNQDAEKAPPIVGLVAEVTTSEVTEKFGMGLVHIKGAPLAIQIRNLREDKFGKGERVLVIQEDRQNHTFEVVKYNQTELEA